MKTAATAICLALAFGGSASAAEKVPAPKCENFAELKAEFAKDPEPELRATKFTTLTAGQWHLVEGIYLGSPLTPPGFPPGSGAVLLQANNKNSILWLRGKDACMTIMTDGRDQSGRPHLAYMPMPISDDQLKGLEVVKTGVGEAAPDDSKDELKL